MSSQRSQQDADGIAPFWKKLGTFLAAPLHMGPAMLLALVAAGGAVAGLVGGLGLILRGIVIFAAIRFAFQLFDHFSMGRLDVNSPDIVTWPPKDSRAAKQGFIILLYVGLVMGIAFVALPHRDDPLPSGTANITETQPDLASPATSVAQPDANGDDAAREETLPDEGRSTADATTAGAVTTRDAAANGGDTSKPRALPAWFWLVAILFAVPLPAATAVLALEDSLIKALNPFHTLAFVRAMGAGYFILLGFFVAIFVVRFAISALGRGLPPVLSFPLEGLAIAYLTIVLYAMLGYVIYQYHGELGLDVAVDFDAHKEKLAEAGGTVLDPLEKKIRAFLAEGKIDKAIDQVRDEMRYNRFDIALNRRLHELYVTKGNNTQTLAHGPQYLDALMREQKYDEALALLSKMEAMDPAFAPEDGDVILPLALAAYKKKDFQKALALVKGFDRRYPKHQHIPDVYLLGAKLSSEFLRNDKQSAAILKALLSRHPDAECVEEAKTYLAVLEKLLAGNVAGVRAL
jgi:tetratricopeptide (TPR) repeat protein